MEATSCLQKLSPLAKCSQNLPGLSINNSVYTLIIHYYMGDGGLHSTVCGMCDCNSRGHKFDQAQPHKFHRA